MFTVSTGPTAHMRAACTGFVSLYFLLNCVQFMLQHCYSLLLLCKNRLPGHHFGRASSKFSRIRLHSRFSKLIYSLRRASSQEPPSCICFRNVSQKGRESSNSTPVMDVCYYVVALLRNCAMKRKENVRTSQQPFAY